MKNILHSISKHPFLKNVGLIAGGTTFAQFIGIAFAPLLTRIYEPSDFGLLAIYSGIIAMLSIFACLRYDMAIPLPENENDAINILFLSLFLLVIVFLTVLLTVFYWIEEISELLKIVDDEHLLWFIPLGVLLIGLYNLCKYWSIRTKNFSIFARTKIIQAISNISIACIGFNFGPAGLLLGHIASQSAGIFTLAKPIFSLGFTKRLEFSSIMSLAVRYKSFPMFSLWGGIANTASMQLPPILFAYSFGQASAGLFLLATIVVSVPLVFFGQAISQVFFGNAVQAHREGKLDKLVFSIFENLSKIGGPPILFIIIMAPEGFSLVFGETWHDAGIMASWLGPWLYFVFITSPLSNISTVTEKQKETLIYHVINFVTRLGAIVYGAYHGDLIFTIILFAMASLFCRVGYLIWIIYISGNSQISVWIQNVKTFLFSLIINIPVILLLYFGSDKRYIYFIFVSFTILLMTFYYLRIAKSLLKLK